MQKPLASHRVSYASILHASQDQSSGVLNKSSSQLGLAKDDNYMQHIISDGWRKAKDIKKEKERQ